MSSSVPPIRPDPKDPYEGYRVDPIEKDPSKNSTSSSSTSKKRPTRFLFWLLHKMLGLLQNITKKKSSSRIEELNSQLKNFQKLLHKLQKDNLCQDNEFLQELANSWLALRGTYTTAPVGSDIRKCLSPVLDVFMAYPEQATVPLHRYLEAYAKTKWIVFPMIKMLSNLHQEAQKNYPVGFLEKMTYQVNQAFLHLAK